jgi:hypothetical protein
MADKMDIKKKRCVTPEFRVSYPAVFRAKSYEGNEAKYSVTMLFKKNVDLSALKRAAHNAAIEKFGPKEKWPKGLRMPFRNGDEKEQQGFKGTIYVGASSKNKPGLIDRLKEPIINEEDFYPGCYARAEIIAFAYDNKGNRGVSFALQNLQKLRDGENLSGRKKAEDVFDAVEDDGDDEENYGDDSDSDDDGGNPGF